MDDAEKITSLMLNEVCTLAHEIGIELTFDKSFITHIAKQSYSKTYGARPIRRAITSFLENPLSEKIIDGEISSGDSVIATLENEKVKFKVLAKK